jgi:hypothetical protein
MCSGEMTRLISRLCTYKDLCVCFHLTAAMTFMIQIPVLTRTRKNLSLTLLADTGRFQYQTVTFRALAYTCIQRWNIWQCIVMCSRTVTRNAANISLLLGLVGLFWTFAEAGDVRFIVLVISAILCGYVYQVKSSARFEINLCVSMLVMCIMTRVFSFLR